MEYLNGIVSLQEQYCADYSLGWTRVLEMVTQVNMRLLNFLSSMRTYLDHTETRLKRSFGDDAERVASFKRATAREFDSAFSYRFVSKLRNYTQHCGMPLGQILSKSELLDLRCSQATHEIDFYFERDSLLNQFAWGQRLTPELRSLPATFPVTPHITAAIGCLTRIDLALLDDAEPEIRCALEQVNRLFSDVSGVEGTPCVLTSVGVEYTPGGAYTPSNVSIQRLPVDLILEIEDTLSQRRRQRLKMPSHVKYAQGWERAFGSQGS
jgi:hypothetical protein